MGAQIYFDNASTGKLQLTLPKEPTWNITQNILNATLYSDWKNRAPVWGAVLWILGLTKPNIATEVADRQTDSDAIAIA